MKRVVVAKEESMAGFFIWGPPVTKVIFFLEDEEGMRDIEYSFGFNLSALRDHAIWNKLSYYHRSMMFVKIKLLRQSFIEHYLFILITQEMIWTKFLQISTDPVKMICNNHTRFISII